jgi:hypothetical protein
MEPYTPAFPTLEEHKNSNDLQHFEGLTARQYFAITAMQGLLSDLGLHPVEPKKLAVCAVACADALIAELATNDPT